MRRRAAAARPDHAEAVRVVEQQPRIVALGERDQLGQRRDVAVHAEYRVRDDQPAPRPRRA
jgi:hypothetical protein